MRQFVIAVVCLGAVWFTLPRASAQSEVFSRGDVNRAIEQIEKHGDQFEHHFDRTIKNTAHDKASRYKDWANEMENAVDDLKKEFKDKDYAKARAKLEEAMTIGAALNRVMTRQPFDSEAQRAWVTLRDDLNTVASGFGVPPLSNFYVHVTER